MVVVLNAEGLEEESEGSSSEGIHWRCCKENWSLRLLLSHQLRQRWRDAGALQRWRAALRRRRTCEWACVALTPFISFSFGKTSSLAFRFLFHFFALWDLSKLSFWKYGRWLNMVQEQSWGRYSREWWCSSGGWRSCRERERVARYHRLIMECVPERQKRQETNREQVVVRWCGDWRYGMERGDASFHVPVSLRRPLPDYQGIDLLPTSSCSWIVNTRSEHQPCVDYYRTLCFVFLQRAAVELKSL